MEDKIIDLLKYRIGLDGEEEDYKNAAKAICALFSVGNSEADVCPECSYPKFKKTFEDFERCHGCNWTSEGI